MDFGRYIRKFSTLPNIFYLYLVFSSNIYKFLLILFVIKMISFDDVARENIKENHPSWPLIPHDPYRILKTGGSGLGKTNVFLNLISHQLDSDKIYLNLRVHIKQNTNC